MPTITKPIIKGLYRDIIDIAHRYSADTEWVNDTLFIDYPILGQGSAIMQLINDKIGADADYHLSLLHSAQRLEFRILGVNHE